MRSNKNMANVNVIKQRPIQEMLADFTGTAITHFRYTDYEQALETAIGVHRLVEEGKEKEARLLIEQAQDAMLLHRMCSGKSGMTGMPGETRSTQVWQMMHSPQYPRDIREVAAKIWGDKYPADKDKIHIP